MKSQSEFLAHYDENSAKKQSIAEHSANVAEIAKQFAVPYMKNIVEYSGLQHDIGKYRDGFQQRILHKSNAPCSHACCGAQEIKRKAQNSSSLFKLIAPMLEYCVSGHHSGLQNGIATENHIDGTLLDSLNQKTDDINKYRSFFEDTPVPDDNCLMTLINKMKEGCRGNAELIERYSFFTRYIFSCLTDADFIDTEKFYDGTSERGIGGSFATALELINNKLSDFPADTDVRKARKELQKHAFDNSDGTRISILNMPTGSGKTLCSVKLALERAASGKKRIIYVIPYTSIIEQTADNFEKIFGETLPILQHHSNYTSDDKEANIIRRTTENWDAPFIITTNVQFFQSVYHNRSSKLRKLHNMAESVIVFDEVHMMPLEYLQPCLRAVGYITSYLDSEAIFMSATMPDFRRLLSEYGGCSDAKELITDRSTFVKFKNCTYSDIGETDEENLLELANSFGSSLIIVNSRKKARELYKMCGGNKYHLSTYMTPKHRKQVISEIKEKVGRKRLTVISTSLIEAGVDLDFEAVFREMSGLDSIIQSAGRCNREGIRSEGTMHVFSLSESKLPEQLKLKANICKGIMRDFDDISSSECVEEYYKRLFAAEKQAISSNTIYSDGMLPDSIPFRDYSESFNFIDSDSINIIIPCDEIEDLINSSQFCKAALRKLSPYCASVHYYEFAAMLEKGIISPCGSVYKLEIPEYYDKETGLDPMYEP